MRVLHTITSMDPALGGVSQNLMNAMPAQLAQGIKGEVVCLDDFTASFCQVSGYQIYALGKARTAWAYQSNFARWLEQHMGHFDVVVVHGIWQYHGYAVYKAIKAMKKRKDNVPRLYIMPHGMLDPYFQTAPQRRLKAMRNWLYWQLIESKIINSSDGVLFTCKEELERARDTFNCYRPKLEIDVGLGVQAPPPFTLDMQRSFLRCCDGLNERPYLLFLSRIDPKKGVDLLLDAYLEAHAEFGKNIPALVIAGPGLESKYGRQMQERARLFQGDIFFPGMLTGEAKWGAFYGCEAFILPSHQENFGIAVVEAMACSKPVLITKKINIWRDIDPPNAALVDDDSPQGIYSLLNRWLHLSSDVKYSMTTAASMVYRRKFCIEEAAKRMANFLAENGRY